MSNNHKGHLGPLYGTPGQSTKSNIGSGGYNSTGKPFGYPSGSSANAKASPQHGAVGQRLASSSPSTKGRKYPPQRKGC